MKKIVLLVFSLLLVLSVSSCTKFNEDDTDNLYAQIVLKDGRKINLQLDYNAAPITVKNFIKLVKSGFYENTIFHRIIPNFMIQGGGYIIDKNIPVGKTSDERIYGEFSENGYENPLKHDLGVISMARTSEPNSATCQFFICNDYRIKNSNISYLDGRYAAFGKTSDSDSKQVILELGNVQTQYYSSTLQNYPVEPIVIKKVNLANTAF